LAANAGRLATRSGGNDNTKWVDVCRTKLSKSAIRRLGCVPHSCSAYCAQDQILSDPALTVGCKCREARHTVRRQRQYQVGLCLSDQPFEICNKAPWLCGLQWLSILRSRPDFIRSCADSWLQMQGGSPHGPEATAIPSGSMSVGPNFRNLQSGAFAF